MVVPSTTIEFDFLYQRTIDGDDLGDDGVVARRRDFAQVLASTGKPERAIDRPGNVLLLEHRECEPWAPTEFPTIARRFDTVQLVRRRPR